MMNTNAARSHATLAAILFFIYGIFQFLLHFWNYTFAYFTTLTGYSLSIFAPLLLGIGFGVIAIIRANNLAGVIITGMGLFICFIDLVQSPCLANFIGLLSGVALLVIMLFVSVEPLKKLAYWVEYLWFIAPILFMLTHIVLWRSSGFFNYFTLSWTYFVLLPIVLLRFFATLLFTMWLRDEAALNPALQKKSQNTILPANNSTAAQNTMPHQPPRTQSHPTQSNPTWQETPTAPKPTPAAVPPTPQPSIPHPVQTPQWENTSPNSVVNSEPAAKENSVAKSHSAMQEESVQQDSPARQPKPIVENLDPIESLKLYREMLDSGTITQETFEAKKQQLIKLI